MPEPRDAVPDAPVAPDVAELQPEVLEALVESDVVPQQRAEVPGAPPEPGVLGISIPVRDGLAALGVTEAPAELAEPDAAEAPDGLEAPDEEELSEQVLDGPEMSFEGFVRALGLAWPPFSSQKRADARPEPYTA